MEAGLDIFGWEALAALADPNLVYLLFVLGLLGLATELHHPGLILPGLLGGLSAIAARAAFGTLPTNWLGVLLIAIAFGFLVAEYLETLKTMGNSPSSKLVLPLELTSLLRPFLAYAAAVEPPPPREEASAH
jgi:hypothetical protein